MVFARPTLISLQNQGLQDIINYNIPGQTALLRRSPLRALNIANSGLVWGNYQYLDYIAQQSVPFTSTGENLLAWGALVNTLPTPATSATDGTVTFYGQSGATIPSATQLATSDGIRFITTQQGSISQAGNSNSNGGVQGVTAVCVSVGANGNLPSGSSLTVQTPIAGVSSQATVLQPFTTGSDIEDETSYRTRVLFAFRNPPQGGSLTDYAEWALQVNGVTRAWALNGELGAGDLYIYFMADVVNQANNGFPIGSDGVSQYELRFPPNTTTFNLNGNPNSSMITASGDQLQVANYVYSLRSATSYVIVKAPTPSTVNFTFSSFYPVNQVVFNAAYQQLQSYFATVATPYGVTITGPGTDDQTGTYYESDYFAALEQTPGLVNFSLSSPTGNITSLAGQLPVVGVLMPPANSGLNPIGVSSGNVNTGGVGTPPPPPPPPVITPPAVPGMISIIVQFDNFTNPSSQISVEWPIPTYSGFDTLVYPLLYSVDGANYRLWQRTSANFATVTGLPAFTNISFMVTAVTLGGISGPQSAVYTYSTAIGSGIGGSGGGGGGTNPQAPGPVLYTKETLSTIPGQFTLSWQIPSFGTQPFTYGIYYSSQNAQSAGSQPFGGSTLLAYTQSLFYTITGWQSDIGDILSFWVIAQNAAGVPGSSQPAYIVPLTITIDGLFALR